MSIRWLLDKLIQCQILQTNIIRILLQTVGRITDEIFRVKGLTMSSVPLIQTRKKSLSNSPNIITAFSKKFSSSFKLHSFSCSFLQTSFFPDLTLKLLFPHIEEIFPVFFLTRHPLLEKGCINPLTPKISLKILFTVSYTILMMLVWRIWY